MQLVQHILSPVCDWNALHNICKVMGQESPTRTLDQNSISLQDFKALPTMLQQYTDCAGAFVYLAFVFILPSVQLHNFIMAGRNIDWAEIGNKRGFTALVGGSNLTYWQRFVIILSESKHDWVDYADQLTKVLKKYIDPRIDPNV